MCLLLCLILIFEVLSLLVACDGFDDLSLSRFILIFKRAGCPNRLFISANNVGDITEGRSRCDLWRIEVSIILFLLGKCLNAVDPCIYG